MNKKGYFYSIMSYGIGTTINKIVHLSLSKDMKSPM